MEAPTSYVIHDREISHNSFDDEVIVVNLATGSYFSLHATAAEIWRLFAHGPATAESLGRAFGRSDAGTTAEIQAFLAQLVERNLLLATTAPVTETKSTVAYASPTLDEFDELRELLLADIIHDTDEQGWPHVAPPLADASDRAA